MKRKGMSFHNSSAFGECPRPKKSKPSEDIKAHWANLPSVLLHDIFSMLNKQDRKNVSAVCKHWRQNSFHPKWWQEVTFIIEQNERSKVLFLKDTFGQNVSRAKIKLDSLSGECVWEFISLLELIKENNNLTSIVIEPSHCRLERPCDSRCDEYLSSIISTLTHCLPKLTKFSIGCLEDLSYYLDDLIKCVNSDKITHLGLASVKDDPMKYQPSYFTPSLIKAFSHLKVLSIDYDQLSDNFLSQLDAANGLERLVVHLHTIQKDHPGTTNEAWGKFCVQHPSCQLRLTIIHAFKDIESLHETVMRPKMPLSHLKVFFCEKVNLELLQTLTTYTESLRSIMWIDSLSTNDNSWIFVKPAFDESPDPFVLIAWLCKRLEEVTLYGYKYFDDNLIAISRLRSDTLKKLELVKSDILCNTTKDTSEFWEHVNTRHPWKCIKSSDLHPVIWNPTDGDSDEYLLPIVLADLY